jgi:molybdate transport system ATP-binding protein
MTLELFQVSLPLAGFRLEIDAVLETAVTGLWGPSGAGKTSLLELIAGLRRPAAGRVWLDGAMLSDAAAGRHVRPHRRRIGYVPQDVALFPHLSVEGNLRYGWHGDPRQKSILTFDHVVDVLDIGTHLSRSIGELSGGEKQRVSLGRALLSNPRLLLLDEPLASLDRALKARILPILRRVRDEFAVPIIYVSHDPNELTALCDEILCLENGRLVERRRHSPQ